MTQAIDAVATALPVAATPAVAALLEGPRRSAVVVGRSRQALYLRDGERYLAVLDHDAVAVPCGLRTTLSGVGSTRRVELGEGRCTIDGTDLAVRRFVDASVPPVADDPAHASALPWRRVAEDLRRHAPGDALAVSLLDDDLLEALRRDDPRAVHLLLGRGPGLTPLGDDLLAGWLVARHALGLRDGRVRTTVARLAPTRTTVVSAALLDDALSGHAIPELSALLRSLGGPGLSERLAALLTVGSSSGLGLALGAALALDRPRHTDTSRHADTSHLDTSHLDTSHLDTGGQR
ncbi:uncharacterized protein DUF2877 [Mumia flava]|uniref:Uncharacterized protein DUF2877 n=1 Tax=Mumia flava TaxID=1348852 RepID=A0A2M9BFF2_9ACTN|nr:DUF2877 domain-containing protein [Mumia flava]PJJ56678.1 uncharacterized protein DUF2877 [Mumia flava]